MALVSLFIFLLLTNLAVLLSAQDYKEYKQCEPFSCNPKIGNLSFPFRKREGDPKCGLFSVDCAQGFRPFRKREGDPKCGLFSVNCAQGFRRIQLKEGGKWHDFTRIDISSNIISMIIDEDLQERLENNPCDDENLRDLSLVIPSLPYVSIIQNQTLLNCSRPLSMTFYEDLKPGNCSSAMHRYYYNMVNSVLPSPGSWPPPECSAVHIPLLEGWNLSSQPFSNFISLEFSIQVTVSEKCLECFAGGNSCRVDEEEQEATYSTVPSPIPRPTPSTQPAQPTQNGRKTKSQLKLLLGLGLGVPTFLAACLFIFWCYRKRCASNKMVLPSNAPNSNLEGRSFYHLGVPVFTYKELEEATNHFHCDKEIGDGGFGIVYHGKLKDGREVAVKRLYEHNSRRAEQFMNEIEILTHLRHKNLVTLYGCTSRHSRDLLLVYEYIANGTVADHLHGDQAASGLLTWPMRMSIARETASALCYLHASDIVHRDVKTTNILLDKNFTVKVADFGISRIFPLHATHVSTAPQGTPGYVDPEYHQCYQLTPKSDVYSFGVVLIELITSLPAVDITRHREEINLSNLAINRIRNGLYSELVDSSLGFESDHEVKRMTIAVAELAFRCLQQNSDARPAMWEVLEDLKRIEGRNNVPRNLDASPSLYSDQIGLLKSTKGQSSPSSVIQNWTSTNSTATDVSV